MNTRLPIAFVQRLERQLGEELPSFLNAMEEHPVRGLRMNPCRKGSEIPFRDAEERIPWCENGWRLKQDSPAGTTIMHEAGAFYLQEPGAMIPAAVMKAQPGEKILDLCAAPGGKSTQIGCDMAGCGLLVCNEPVPRRAAILSRNIERMGIPNALVISGWPDQLAEKWPEGFDGVMVDAPCSGEGMFRREPGTIDEWSPEKAAGCSVRQREILNAAVRMVRPGGRMVYATCTFNPEENECQTEWILRTHPELEMEAFSLPGVDGKSGYYVCWPHRSPGEGQFVALFRKKGQKEAVLSDGSGDFHLDRVTLKRWRENEILTVQPNAAFGRMLIRLDIIPDLRGIRVLRLGLHLGELRDRHALPDHAAAMSFEMQAVPEKRLTETEALKYLAGEILTGEETGWTVLSWNGLRLGWAKGSGGQLKNHYPKGLRNGLLTG